MDIEQMTDDDAAMVLFRLVNHHLGERFEALKGKGRKLAHYTSAENALSIISGGSLWLRNAALMNDFMEISYGKHCMAHCLEEVRPQAEMAIDGPHPGLFEDVLNQMTNVDDAVRNHTYLASLAEYDSGNRLGKLSMWRAYGGPVAGVAIVFNTDVYEEDENNLGVFLHPVLYGSQQFASVLVSMMTRMQQNAQVLARVPRERAQSILFHAFQDLMLTTKHSGFQEEDEWRLIHSPLLFSSAFLQEKPCSINGIPQIVYPIELRDQPGLNMPTLELDQLIHRIIVGPCQYPEQVCHALSVAMEKRNISDPRSRIVVSDIPLRQRG